jgi:hypothetical protein
LSRHVHIAACQIALVLMLTIKLEAAASVLRGESERINPDLD